MAVSPSIDDNACANRRAEWLHTWPMKSGLFCCLVLAAGVAVRLRSFAADVDPYRGIVNNWPTFWIVAAVTTAAAWVGAAVGVALGTRWWGLLLAFTAGAIAASAANPRWGAVWGLIVGTMVVLRSARWTAAFLGIGSLVAIVGFFAPAVARHLIIGPPPRWLTAAAVIAAGGLLQLWLLMRLRREGSERDFGVPILLVVIGLLPATLAGWVYGLTWRVERLARNQRIVLRSTGALGHSELEIDLKDPSSADLATLRHVPGIVSTAKISGQTLDDSRSHELSSLAEAYRVDIHNTRLTGDTSALGIHLSRVTWLDVSDTPLTDAGLLAMVGGSKSLSRLSLRGTRVTGAGLARLSRRRSVAKLDLESEELSDADLAQLSKLPFVILDLNCPRVTPQGLTELANSPNLKHLFLRIDTLTKQHVVALAELRRRRQLQVHCRSGSVPSRPTDGGKTLRFYADLRIDQDASLDELDVLLTALERADAQVSIDAPSSSKPQFQQILARFHVSVTFRSDDENSPPNADRPSEPGGSPIAHWLLAGDTQDRSGNGRHAIAHGPVDLGVAGPGGAANSGAGFNGRDTWLEVAGENASRLGLGEFSIAAWVYTEDTRDDVPGDIISQYSATQRRGFHLSLKSNAVTTSVANDRHLHFGIDNDRASEWIDCGRPGSALLAFSLAVHEDGLYAGTCEPGAGESGRVYRYLGEDRWLDCGAPDGSNSVTALASFEGALFAGTGKYRLAGSALPESQNVESGGRVFRYSEPGHWIPCGSLPNAEAVGGMVVFRRQLYATSLYPPAGFYRYDGAEQWTGLGTPDGKRVNAMAVHNGHLYATSYDGGHVYRFDGERWTDCGRLGENTQTYSFAVYQGRLYVGTWPSGRVYRFEDVGNWTDVGRLGEELEVMGMLVHNGRLLAGTLPLAQVYAYEGETAWKHLTRLDHTPDVKYRRAWTMAEHAGQVYCSTLPSGRIFKFAAGHNVTWGKPLSSGWRHVTAVKTADRLLLYVDGERVAESTPFDSQRFELNSQSPLRIGFGENAHFHGRLADVRLYQRALNPEETRELSRLGKQAVIGQESRSDGRHRSLQLTPEGIHHREPLPSNPELLQL